ncbi:MAG: translocation/assembly module TamB domain-containing protein, partial [Myxococcaceae bacterium]
VDAAGVSLYELLSNLDVKGSWADLKLNTRGLVQGQIKPEFSLSGHAKGQASGLIVKDKKLLILQTAYPIEFEMGLVANKHAFQFKKARFKDGRSEFVADCDLFIDKPGMWLEAQFDKLDFASVKNKIVDGSYKGSGKAHVLIDGPYENLRIEAPSQIQDFKFEDILFGNLEGLFSFENNQIFVKNIKATRKSLEYTGDFSVLLDKPVWVKFDANLHHGLAQDLIGDFLSGPIQGQLSMDGPVEQGYREKLSGHANLSFMKDHHEMTAVLNLQKGVGDFKITHTPLGDVDFALQIKNDQLTALGLIKDFGARSNIQISLKDQLPFVATLLMPYGPLKYLEDWNAQAGVNLSAKGDLNKIEDAKVILDLSPAVFYLGTLKFLAADRISARYENRQLILKPALFKSVHGDQIELSATLNSKELDMNAATKGDLWFLTHLDERIEGAYGDFNSNLQIKGPWKKLGYFGKGQISSGSYVSLRDYPPGLTNLSGEINFQAQRAALQLEGVANKGHFKLDGFVNLDHQSFEHLQVDLKQMPVYYSSFLTGISNGFLNLDGPWQEPTLSGNVQFSQMLITKELDPVEFKAPRSRAKKQSVKLNILLDAEDNVRIESKSLNAELKGNLNLVGTTNSPGLIGELNVLSGEVYFRNNYYHIVKARANFDNPFRIAPYIDVEANGQILDYDVTVRAQGELAKPKLVFSSKPSLPQTDLLSLITFGFTNRDNKDNLGAARTAGLEALSAYSGVGDRVLKLLPEKSIDELRLGTLYNQNGGVTSSVVLGMQVFKTMRLRFQSAMLQNTAGNREKRLELEKYINKRWRWRLIWNSEGVTNYGDAGADLWIRWDY